MEETLKKRFEAELQQYIPKERWNNEFSEAILFAMMQAAYNMALPQWVRVEDKTPPLIDGENYSENVFGIVDGEIGIYCYCYIPGEDGGFVWANCYNKIDGDAEFDDGYNVTKWQPLPTPPNPED